jgi:rhodanese-related sulfurtransferase
MARTVDELLDEARRHIDRLHPVDAAQAVAAGAALIDIRPEAQRRREGAIPGAIVIERNVLEWRLDPACDYRLPDLATRDRYMVVICSEGYSSSFAAASLHELGLRAADVIGGFIAWAAADLPTCPAEGVSGPT